MSETNNQADNSPTLQRELTDLTVEGQLNNVRSKITEIERSRHNLNVTSFYFTWLMAVGLVITILYVVCQGINLVNKEIEFAKDYIESHQSCCSQTKINMQQSENSPTPKAQELSKSASLASSVKVVDTKASATTNGKNGSTTSDTFIAGFISAYGKSLIFFGVMMSILTTAFITLALSANKMFQPKPTEKLDSNNSSIETNYPPVDWFIKVFEALTGKKKD